MLDTGALPRGRSVCKLPLHLQPGPGTCLRCLGGDLPPPAGPRCSGSFKAGQSWQRSQRGVGLRHRPSPVSPWERKDRAAALHGGKDVVHLARHIMGSSPG